MQYENLPQTIGSAPQQYASSYANLLGNELQAIRPPQPIVPQIPNWGGSIANSLSGLGQTIASLPIRNMEIQKAMSELPTIKLKNEIAQDYLNKVQSGEEPVAMRIGPGGVEMSTPAQYQNKALIDIGQGHFYQGSGQRPQAPQSPPVVVPPADTGTPPSPATPGEKVRQQIEGASSAGSDVSQPTVASVNPNTYDADALRAQIAAQTGNLTASAQGGGPPVAETASPTPLDDQSLTRNHYTPEEALAWHNKYINTNGVSAHQEFDPNTNLPTNRNVVVMKDGSQQPIHSAYIAEHTRQNPGNHDDWQNTPAKAPNPALGINPARVPALIAAASQPAANAITQQLQQAAMPAVANGSAISLPNAIGQLPNIPISTSPVVTSDQTPISATGNAQMAPADWASSPQATTAAIGQVGSPLAAENNPQAGVRTDVPVQRAQPVYRAPANPPSTAGATSPDFWVKTVGENPDDFGKRALDPAFIAGKGQAAGTDTNGIHSDWMDVQGRDGLLHRVYVDPARDGGRASYASMYLRSNVVGARTLPDGSPDPNSSGLSEHRDYLDGTETNWDNKPLADEMNKMSDLVTKWGTAPAGTTFSKLDQKQQEASYRAALQFENQKPMPPEDKDHMLQLQKIMQLGSQQQQLVSTMSPRDHDEMAQVAQDVAHRFGARMPDWASSAVKSVIGNDIKTPNPKLTQLLQTHAQLAEATRHIATSSAGRYNEKGEENLDREIGDPRYQDYGDQLNNFMTKYVYPDAGRLADVAYANHWALPKDFAFHQGTAQFGQNYPGATRNNPIIVKSQEQEDAAANGAWLMDSRGKPYRKDWEK